MCVDIWRRGPNILKNVSHLHIFSEDGSSMFLRNAGRSTHLQVHTASQPRRPHRHGEISGSHGDWYEYGCLLGCCTVWSDRILPTFQRCLLSPLSGLWVLIALILEAASTSETSVNFYQTTRRSNPEDSHLHLQMSHEHPSQFTVYNYLPSQHNITYVVDKT
jgi:hypothetical protein